MAPKASDGRVMSKFKKGDRVSWTLGDLPDYQGLKVEVQEVLENEVKLVSYLVTPDGEEPQLAYEDELELEAENDCE